MILAERSKKVFSLHDLNEQKLHPNSTKVLFFFFCFFFNLGTFMYNKTDGGGWCFTAYCNLTCNVEKLARLCRFTTPAPSTTVIITTESSPATANISTTPKYKDCLFLTPPRKVLEFIFSTSWFSKHSVFLIKSKTFCLESLDCDWRMS